MASEMRLAADPLATRYMYALPVTPHYEATGVGRKEYKIKRFLE